MVEGNTGKSEEVSIWLTEPVKRKTEVKKMKLKSYTDFMRREEIKQTNAAILYTIITIIVLLLLLLMTWLLWRHRRKVELKINKQKSYKEVVADRI